MSGRLVLDLVVPLDRFTLSIAWETSERFLGIFGPSGAGKTTILEAIAGLRRTARGVIRLDGRTCLDSARGIDLAPERRGVGYVPQDGLLFPHRDVFGNLLAGWRRAVQAAAPLGSGPRRRLAPERVLEVLELASLARRPIATLSGGEQRRVALGRALCSGPDLLLLDEPLAGLDAPLQRRILTYLLRVRDEFGIPSIVVSHEATEIRTLADEVAVLSRGEVIARGRPDDLFTRPSVLPLARLGGFDNVLRGRVTGLEEGAALVDLGSMPRLTLPAEGLRTGDEVTFALRAEDLIVALERPAWISAQNIVPGTIREVRQGSEEERQVLVVVDPGAAAAPAAPPIGGGAPAAAPLVAAVTRQACQKLGLRPGLPVHLIAKAQACRILASR